MKDFIQLLQDAFPILRTHPILIARLALLLLLLGVVYGAKEKRKKICYSWLSKLEEQIFSTSRWLYVYQDTQLVNDWKYYTSQTTGKGEMGDDVIWTLVRWPSLEPVDTFTVPRAVGMLDGITESQTILHGRWNIVHDPDSPGVGFVPARGLMSKLRRTVAKALQILGSI
jgi:hypothetical protein